MVQINPLMHLDGALGFFGACLWMAAFVVGGAAHQCYQDGENADGQAGSIAAVVLFFLGAISLAGAILTYTPAP